MSALTYDCRTNSELVAVTAEFAEALDYDTKREIVDHCECGNYNVLVQMPPIDEAEAHTITLGEAAATAADDPGTQRVDVQAIRNLAFGPQGIIKPSGRNKPQRMLALPNIVYVMKRGQPENPVIGSGRHRCLFLQMLALAAGVPWETIMEQSIWVTKQVARNYDEFSAAMQTANSGTNGPRSQPPVEKIGFALSATGVDISSVDSLLSTYPGIAGVKQYPDLVGMLAALACKADIDPAFVFDVFKRAFGFTYKATSENRAPIQHIFKQEQQRLRQTVETLAEDLPEIRQQVTSVSSVIPAKTRVAEILSSRMAEDWNVIPKSHDSETEVARKKIEEASRRIKQIESIVA